MYKRWAILQLLFSIIYAAYSETNSSKKLVCVVGTGPNGIVAVKHLADNRQDFIPIAFEKNSDIGGLWIYTDSSDVDEHGLPVHSSVHKNLRTTDAKEVMGCPDYQEFDDEERSSVTHDRVLNYLRNYTDYFNLRQYIRFNTLVEKVVPITNPKSQQSPPKWSIQFRNLNTNESRNIICDIAMIANGPFQKPNIPKIPGLNEFPGRMIHSHVYRKPDKFINQTVVVLGASVSGLDIAFDLSKHVKTIYLSHRHDKIKMEMPKNVIQVAGVIAGHGNQLILQDGTNITVDSFIYCTGYKNYLPFLDSNSGIEVHDKYLYPLYRRTINVNHPSMAILGFTRNIMSFCPKFYLQAKYYIAYLQGKVKLPSREEMLEEAKLMTAKKMTVKSKTSFAYMNQLIEDGKFEPLPKCYERGSAKWEKLFINNRLHLKDYKMIILDDETVKIVKLESNDEQLKNVL